MNREPSWVETNVPSLVKVCWALAIASVALGFVVCLITIQNTGDFVTAASLLVASFGPAIAFVLWGFLISILLEFLRRLRELLGAVEARSPRPRRGRGRRAVLTGGNAGFVPTPDIRPSIEACHHL